jgi:diacylglycerol kinase family enzyme
VSAVGQMLLFRRRSPRGRNTLTVTGLESLTIRSVRPIAFQVDGDYLGETEAVKFQFVPQALRVVARPVMPPGDTALKRREQNVIDLTLN